MGTSRKILAVDLGGTKVAAAVVTPRGRILARVSEPVARGGKFAPVTQICALAQRLAAPGVPRQAFASVAVAVPGLVRRDGTVWAPNLRGWSRMPLAAELRRRLRLPAMVESDRNAAVLGEAWRGAARGKSDAIVLIIGTGIGAGILSGGRLIRGAHELSGCAGWLAFSSAARAEFLRCGELESRAAGPGIARAAGSRHRDAQGVAAAARRGDARARKIFRDAGVQLGLACANLISLFDPEVIVIGGGMAGAGDLYLRDLRQTALARCQPLNAKRAKIVVSKLGGDANLLGMASLAMGKDNRR